MITRGLLSTMVLLTVSISLVAMPNEPPPNYIRQIITSVSSRHGIDKRLVQAVITIESGFNIHAVSHAGARGLMQLMPATARELGVRNSFVPYSNVDGGTRYLVQQLKRFGSVRHALWAYHAGPSRVSRGNIPKTTIRYANLVLKQYWKLRRPRPPR